MANHQATHLGRTVRILVVDDHPIVRDGLAAQIATQPDLSICGEADDTSSAMAMLDEAAPDVAIVDISLKSGSGLDLIKRLKARRPDVRVLVWSMYPEEMYARRALQVGAMGYVHKGRAARDILHAVRCVLDGHVFVSEQLSTRLLSQMVGPHQPAQESPVDALSDRELEVFTQLGRGLSTKQIAKNLHLSDRTVETYRTRIKDKLRLENVHELTLRAVQWAVEES